MHAVVDQDARQKAVKITVTGQELAAIEGDYIEARDRAKRYTDMTKDGAGSFGDLARMAQAFYEVAAACRHLYVLTGGEDWRLKAETGRSGGSQAIVALGSREREAHKALDGLNTRLSELESFGSLHATPEAKD